VALHDPTVALFGGPDGLAIIRCVVAQAKVLLRPGGRLLIEHGEFQGGSVRELLEGFHDVHTWPDLTGRPRVTGGVLA
jgi:release factor glutamine methyltransferase